MLFRSFYSLAKTNTNLTHLHNPCILTANQTQPERINMAASTSGKQGTAPKKPTISNHFAVEKGLLLTAVPPAPDILSPEGVKWWNYYCTIFVEGQVLSRLFITSITNLCLMHMLRADIFQELTEQGAMIVEYYVLDKQMFERKKYNPLAKELCRVITDMDKLLASMGCTAYTARVNNFDTKGNLQATRQGPSADVPLFKPEG